MNTDEHGFFVHRRTAGCHRNFSLSSLGGEGEEASYCRAVSSAFLTGDGNRVHRLTSLPERCAIEHSSSMKKYNVGIIGYGWAASGHIPAINAVPQAQVTAICSSRKLNAAELSAKHG